jgi:hypothetical protein
MGDSMSTIINATTTNGVVIQPDNSGSLVLQTNSGTTALTIDTSQRAAFVAGTAAAPAITTTGDTNTGMWFPAADTIAFAEGGTESMRIDSSGNVLVGTTTNNSRNPRLALNGNSVTWSVGPSSSNSVFVVYNPSEAGVYLPSGNTAWVSTSDERLKNITGEITGAINKVSQLRAAEFTWKSDESNKPQVGLIAQDVQSVLPEAISENDKEFLGVSYTDVIPLLVAAIQEQQTIINDLKARVEALEAK